MTPLEYCESKVHASGSSFLTGFKYLNPDLKNAFVVLYAYCRELDDIVDGDTELAVAKASLEWRRQDLKKIFENQTPEHPIHQALVEVVQKYHLPYNELEEVINGMEMDLVHVRYNTFEDLKYYCHRVAGVVGRLICRLLGYKNEKTMDYAESLGLALQLTNIIRDVGADARRGRIYLPIEDLEQYNVPAEVILSRDKHNENYQKMMTFQIQRAKQYYREAIDLLPPEDKSSQKVGLVFAAIYYALLEEIELDGVGNNLRYKIKIPNPRKLRIAAKTWILGFNPK